MTASAIAFRPLIEADLPQLHRWFNTPHVSQWWEVSGKNRPSLELVTSKYSPRFYDQDPVDCYVIHYDGQPVGMIQACNLDDFPEEKTNFSIDESCISIDILIGEPDYVHLGLGSTIIREFLRTIVFKKYDADLCLVDPGIDNEIAIKAYQKAGFKYLKTVLYEKENKREHLFVIHRRELEADKE